MSKDERSQLESLMMEVYSKVNEYDSIYGVAQNNMNDVRYGGGRKL
jgi:hypothetical protein